MALEDKLKQAIEEKLTPVAIAEGLIEKAQNAGANPLNFNQNETYLLMPYQYGKDIHEKPEAKEIMKLPDRILDSELRKHIKSFEKDSLKELASVVEPVYSSIIGDLNEKYLPTIFMQTPAGEVNEDKYGKLVKAKKRIEKAKKASEGDIEAYLDLIENKNLKNILQSYMSPETLVSLAKQRVSYESRKLAEEIGKVNLREYLTDNISTLEEKNKFQAYKIAANMALAK